MEDRPQSTFNMAAEYLRSLRMILNACHDASMSLDAYTWYHELYALERELCTEMKPGELEEIEEKLNGLSEEVNYWVQNQQKGITGMEPELRKAFHEIEVKLRLIMKKAGLQIKVEGDALSKFN